MAYPPFFYNSGGFPIFLGKVVIEIKFTQATFFLSFVGTFALSFVGTFALRFVAEYL